MNTLIQAWKKNEELPRLFKISENNHLKFVEATKEVKSHNRQAQINILKALVEDCDGMKESAYETMGKVGQYYLGYKQSIDDTITTLDEFKKYLEEL